MRERAQEVFFYGFLFHQTICVSRLFIAVTILLTFVFSIQTTFLRLSFSFLPIALCGAYFGAVPAGFMTAASGFIGTAVLGLGVFFRASCSRIFSRAFSSDGCSTAIP